MPDSKLAHAATELVRTVSSETLYRRAKHLTSPRSRSGPAWTWGGIGLEQLVGTDVDEVLRHFPSVGFTREAIRTVLQICEKKPFSTLMTAFAEVGRAHDPFFLVPTLEDIVLLAPFPD